VYAARCTGPLFAVDTPSLVYRAFYALPKSIKGSDGAPVNALLGTANLVLQAVDAYEPRATVLCFGAEAGAYRVAAFPDVPTATEAGLPGYEVSTWYAMWAQKNLPPEVVEKMTPEVKKALAAPMVSDAGKMNGAETPNLYGPAFGAFVNAEVARWGKVVADANVKPD